MNSLERRRGLRLAVPAAGLAVVAAIGTLVAIRSRSVPPISKPVCRGDILVPKGLPPPSQAEEGTRPPDRLKLDLAGDGSIGTIRVGDRTLPSLGSTGGFSVRPAGDGPNLVQNESFERDSDANGVPDGWTFTKGTGETPPQLDVSSAHSGADSIRVSNPATQRSGTFRMEVRVDPNTFYVFSAWFRSQNIRPYFPTAIRETYHPHSPVRIDVEQLSGGTVLSTASVWGYTGTADWNRQFAGVRTRADVTSVRIVGWIEDGSGTGWFDDLYLGRLFPQNAIPVRGNVATEPGGRAVQRATIPAQGLSLRAAFTAAPDHVRVDGVVTGDGRSNHAFQLSFTLPVDATEWEWSDNARTSRTIAGGAYAYLSTTSLQQASRYPWGVISDTGSALALGVPLDQPRMFKIAYDASAGLTITFDLGISPDATALKNRATFSFVVFTADPVWRFRSATQRYYDLFPQFFARRTNPACEGTWFVAPPLDSIGRTYLDFGLGLDMIALGKAPTQSHATWGTRYLGSDNTRHIATTAYTHQWTFYDQVGRGRELPYEQAIAHLEAEARRQPANDEQRRIRAEAAAALQSTERDFNGRLLYERFGGFYAYYQNVDTMSSDGTDWAGTADVQQVERARNLAIKALGWLNGIHLDSTSGMRRWGAADDYDRRHWSSARIPLTFSYDSGQVVVRGIFPMYDRIEQLANYVGLRGMMLTANFNATETQTLGFVGADRIDYFGLEQGLADRARPGMSADQFALLKRTLAYQRPVSTLDHLIGQGKLDASEIARRLQQNLFYGMFSGAFDAASEAEATGRGPTWSTPENARLWARYTPLIKEVAMAGWQPVTDAWTSRPQVWVERFGALATRDLHLALRNESRAAQRVVLTIDIRALRADPSRMLRAVEQITGLSLQIAANRSAGVAVVTISVPPRSTRMIAITEESA
jgi:hypothetical protein